MYENIIFIDYYIVFIFHYNYLIDYYDCYDYDYDYLIDY